MKKSRLLEIIREEITTALTEAGLGDQILALQKQKDALEKQKAPLTKKEADLSKKIADLEKKEADAEVKSSSQLEEDQLNEMAKITEPIRKGIEVAVDRMTKQKSDITPEEITRLIRNKKSQEKVAPELFAALEADADEKGGDPKYTFGLGYPQTLGAVQIAMGLKKAKGSEPKAEKPKAEPKAKAEKAPKAKKATLTPGDDGFDDVSYSEEDDEVAAATKSISSDPTAKKLGKIAYSKKLTPEEETQYKTALKGIEAKIKRIEDGEEKPDDRTLLKKAYQNSEIQRLFKAKGSNLNDILKGIIG